MQHLGSHGLPDMLKSDWDDSLAPMNKGGTAGAESVFVFFQLADAAFELIQLYQKMGREEKAAAMRAVYDYCASKLDVIWDGKWFIRAFTPEGEKFCTKEDEYNKIHLIPQAWSVISHLADKEKANKAMDNVLRYLYTDKGLITHYPASEGFDPENKCYFLFPAGAKENGGIFFHSNTWPIIAFAMLGRGNDAFRCYENILPIRRNDAADIHRAEPYVYCSTMSVAPHPEAGRCVNSWLTGTASWAYFAATQHILGVRPEYDGLCIDTQIPDEWSGFSMERYCREKLYKIEVIKESGYEKGLYVNEKIEMSGNNILLLINLKENDFETEEIMIKRLCSLCRKNQDKVGEYMDISLSCIFSNVGSFQQLPLLYQDIINVEQYRLYYGKGCIVSTADIIEKKRQNYVYSVEKESELVNVLNKGELEEVKARYLEIINSLYFYPPSIFYANILRLWGAIDEAISFWEYKDREKDICNEMAFFDMIIKKQKNWRDSKHTLLIDKINLIITEESSNKNLSLDMIADRLNMSTNYVGKLFKKYTGKSIVVRINEDSVCQASDHNPIMADFKLN